MRGGLDVVYSDFAKAARVLRFRATTDVSVVALRPLLGELDVSLSIEDLKLEINSNAAFRGAVETVLDSFATLLGLAQVQARISAAIDGDDDLQQRLERFVDYDEATLALRELIPGENDDIEVIRVSPRDTTSLVDEAATGPKLAGSNVHHFGGFF